METITMSGKIRDRIPESPLEQSALSRRRSASQPRVIHNQAIGVAARDYAALPTGLWSEMVSLLGSTLKEAAGAFNAAFKHGAEPHLQDLVQTFIPQLVYSLGRQLMEAVLNQERAFYGSRIRCPDCGQVLEFEGYIERGVNTKLGPIRFKRILPRGLWPHGLPHRQPAGHRRKARRASRPPGVRGIAGHDHLYPQALELLQRLLPVGTFSLHLQEEVTRSVASDFIVPSAMRKSQKPGWRDGEELQDKTVVASVDGGMCRVRDHADRYREFKLAVMGELGPNLEVTNKTYVATFEGPNALFHKAIFEYVRKGHDRAQRVHLVADGAS